MFQRMISTPLGELQLVASNDALTGVYFRDYVDAQDARSHDILDGAARELGEYFRGERREFSTRLAFDGTEFQRSVWSALTQIPFGETRSYVEIARAIGRPSAVRAVGAANGMNPISIIVPCHRVIGADGTLTGYGGGLEKKRWLLDHEQAGRASKQQQLRMKL